MTLISPIKLNIAEELKKDRKFRERFFRGQAQDRIAMSIKELRKKRKKLQADLAKETNMMQSAVSRIEQADYSGWSFNTLFRVANALEARLTISFEPVEDVINWYKEKEAVVTTDNKQFANIQAWNDAAKTHIEGLVGTETNDSSHLIQFTPRRRVARDNRQLCRQALQG